MDKLVETSLKQIGNIDYILSNAVSESLSSPVRKSISSQFNSLFSAVDTELKQNDSLNQHINDLIEMKKVLNYDVKNHFMESNYFTYGGEDVYTGDTFNEEEFEYAKKFVQTWEADKKELEEKISKLQNSRLKFLTNGVLAKCEEKLKQGNRDFERYTKIFEEEKMMKSIDKEKLEADFRKKLNVVKGTISSVIDKHILEEIQKDPSIICFDVFCKKGKGYSFISSSENSTTHNKNIYKYFDSSEINEKLSQILNAYNKQKIHASANLENAEPSME